jgi:hypothetical protein
MMKARTASDGIRFFARWFVRGLKHGKRRTSGAKALNGRGLYGTAEAVPFVKVRCMARLKPCTSLRFLS